MGLLKPIIQEGLEVIEKDAEQLLEAKECEERISGKIFRGLNKEFLFENTELNSSISQCRCKNIIWKNTGLVNASYKISVSVQNQ